MKIISKKDGRIFIRGNMFEYARIVDMMHLEVLRDKNLTVEKGVSNRFLGGYQGILRPKTQEELDKDFERSLFNETMGDFSTPYVEFGKRYKEHRIRYYGDRLWTLFDEKTIKQLKYPRAYVK